MIALLIAAQLAAQVPATAVPLLGPVALRGDAAQGCLAIQQQVIANQREGFRKLGRLPPAALEYAVMRRINGCGVPAPMGYHPPAPPETPAQGN